jgi:hypothetical protein
MVMWRTLRRGKETVKTYVSWKRGVTARQLQPSTPA